MNNDGIISSSRSLGTDEARLGQLFGHDDLLPLWIAEPYLPVAEPVRAALEERAALGWYGYEGRPDSVKEAFWAWMERRHDWSATGLTTIVSPSVGSSIGVMINELSDEGDGVIIQPPVFTDFKALINSSGRRVIRNGLRLTEDGYRMDLEGLASLASDPKVRIMILCNPHNPVGRQWSERELAAAAQVCADNDVVVIADEIHADLAIPPNTFVPFAKAAAGTGVSWLATHGPIKTFGLAGVCDTVLITDDGDLAGRFKAVSNRLHLTRNNVFAIAAFETAYQLGAEWLDGLLGRVSSNLTTLRDGLPQAIRVMPHEATYLAWLDFREAGLEVLELARWLAASGLALSPGHWFGREGAGFARMSVAVEGPVIEAAIQRLGQSL